MSKYDVVFAPPVMNAAGMLGFAPNLHSGAGVRQMGAFVTNPISLERRTPAKGVRYCAFPGGFLLHTGYPNPGVRTVSRRYAAQWARSPIPVIVHLLARTPADFTALVGGLEGLEGVAGFELGLPPDLAAGEARRLVEAASRSERPVIARLPFEAALQLVQAAVEAGAAAVSVAPPRGSLPAGEQGLVRGRLYGPGLFPLALEMVCALVQLGVPVIGCGGVYTLQQVKAMLAAGALGVQVDSLLWREGGLSEGGAGG